MNPKETTRHLTLLFEGGTVLSIDINLPLGLTADDDFWLISLLDWMLYILVDDIYFELLIPFIFLSYSVVSWIRRRRQRTQQERRLAEDARQMRSILERIREAQI